MNKYFALAALVILAACNGGKDEPVVDDSIKTKPVPLIAYNVVAEYPHDTSAYTQGLEFYNDKLYEGTGDYENSSLRITDYKTGKVEKKHMIVKDGDAFTKNRVFTNHVFLFNLTGFIVCNSQR